MLQSLLSAERVNLAGEQPFVFGDMRVEPARLTVQRGDRQEVLEPRVMAVLVVLAQAGGRVVSRYELVDRCWDGRIVGDNAIQRAVSRLRHVSATLGGFEVQTVTKVGYLVRPTQPDAPVPTPAVEVPPEATGPVSPAPGSPAPGSPAPGSPAMQSPAPVSRRGVIGMGAALAAAAVGALGWQRSTAADPGATAARQLIAKAHEEELAGLRESNLQAIAYLKRATELDPRSADAWGNLALAYQHRMEQSADPDLPALAQWTRSAAGRALALDPGSTPARIALATIPPNFRRWAANERTLHALQQTRPPHPMLEGALGWLLCDTGRWRDAIACFRQALALEPFHPINQLILASALWGAGHLDEAEQLQSAAVSLWPQNRTIWQSRFDFLALSGRPEAAVAFVDNAESHPVISPDQEPPPYAALRAFALQMQTGNVADVDRVVGHVQAARGAVGTHSVVTYLLALGRIEAAFDLLQQRIFGGGSFPPPGPLSRRKTSILFSVHGAPLRRDPRYDRLIRRTGLADYWRETGTRPDGRPAGAIRL